MRVDWFFTGCDEQDEREIESCWETEQQLVEARLDHAAQGPSELGFSVVHADEMPEWQIQAALHFPARTLVAESAGNHPAVALHNIVESLSGQIERLDDLPTEAERRRQGLQAVLPILEHARGIGRGDVFFTFLQPILRSLTTHARRELDILETEGVLGSGDLDIDDVLDETIVRAWERFDQRPPGMSVDIWLVQFFDGVIADLSHGGFVRQSLEERLPIETPISDGGDDSLADTWLEQSGYPETIELGELLPGHDGIDAWDELDDDSKHLTLTRLFAQLSRDQRHALVLHAVDGYETPDIALMQSREVAEVEADINAARQTLGRELTQRESLIESAGDFETRGGRDTSRRRR